MLETTTPATPVFPAQLYHGTRLARAESIEREGFLLSGSGGGQKGLRAVWFADEISHALQYAQAYPGENEEPGLPVILTVEVDVANLVVADLRGLGHTTDVWRFVGYDYRVPEHLEVIRSAHRKDALAVTDFLIERGFNAVVIDTTTSAGTYEYALLDPSLARVVDMSMHPERRRWGGAR